MNGSDPNPESYDYFVYSVLNESEGEPNLRALKTTKKGYQEIKIKLPPALPLLTVDAIEKAIMELEDGNKNVYHVPNSNFPTDLVRIEEVHSQVIEWDSMFVAIFMIVAIESIQAGSYIVQIWSSRS